MAGLPNGALTAAISRSGMSCRAASATCTPGSPTPVDPAARFQIAGGPDDVVDRDNVTVTLAVRMNGGGTDVRRDGEHRHGHAWRQNDWRVRLMSVEEPFVIERLRQLDGFIRGAGYERR
jgi:hypothetical protein